MPKAQYSMGSNPKISGNFSNIHHEHVFLYIAVGVAIHELFNQLHFCVLASFCNRAFVFYLKHCEKFVFVGPTLLTCMANGNVINIYAVG